MPLLLGEIEESSETSMWTQLLRRVCSEDEERRFDSRRMQESCE